MDILSELVGASPAIEAVRETIRRLLSRPAGSRRLPSILVQGETGTGKGLVARLIHRAGPRGNGPFVDVNCAAIPDALLEAELFGFERGAFTDARRSKPGLFQTAHRGTIFLDEVGLLPEGLQAKLLKVIEEQAVRRLGSTQTEPVDAWIITATNADLQAEIRDRRFREDLYHRLAVLTLRLPPLRERGQDIVLLAERLLAQACADYGLPPKRLGADAPARLLAYGWPGNVRELSNVIERVALLGEGPVVTADALGLPQPAAPTPAAPPWRPPAAGVSLDEAMREHVLAVLGQTAWNISRSAALLGISRNTLRARIDKLGLRAGGRAAAPARRPERAVAEPRAAYASAPHAAPTPIRWDRRRITLMRAALVLPADAEAPADTSRALDILLDKVRTFGGRVEELSRTGVGASFGLEPVEDAPRRAAHAAMAIHKAAARTRLRGGEGFPLKIGIHVGQVLVGQSSAGIEIDADAKRAQWMVLDALLEGAPADSAVVSAAAAPFLERRFELIPVGTAGEGHPTYRLGGRERTGLGLSGRMGKFVGRRHEMDLLRSRLAYALAGRGQVLALVGDPGVGKSRLVWEFLHGQGLPDCLVLEAGCLSYGAAASYLPVAELLRAYFRLGGDDGDGVRAKVTDRLRRLDASLEARAPALLALLDAPVDDPQWLALEPSQRRQQTLDAVKRVLVRESQQQPLLLVFEDVHWLDSESQALLDTLVESLPTARVLLVVTYRPEYEHGWGSRSYYTQLRVHPLPRESAEELLYALLGDDPTLGPLKPLLIEWTEGNPFFLEESVRTLGETAVLAGEPGAYRLVKPVPAIQVPATVEEVLAARIDRLPPEARSLLQCAAVIGKDVPFAILSAVAGLTEPSLRVELGPLQAAELLYETGVFPKHEYTFKHALTHEVAYGSLPPDRRRALHAAILGSIEALYPDHPVEQLDRLAHHAFHGGVWDKAAAYLRQAGHKAFAHSANREAVGCFEQALAALDHLPESPERLAQAIDLRFDLRTALLPLGELDRVLERLREAEALAVKLGDQHRLGQLLVYLTGHGYLMGDHDRAFEYGQRALAITEARADFNLAISTHAYLGQVSHARGDYRRAAAFFRKNVEALVGELASERFGLPQLPSVHSRTCLVWSLSELGEFAEGVMRGKEGLQIAESVDQPLSLTVACSGLGVLYARTGDVQQAVPLLERGLELSRAWNFPLWFPRLASALGSAYALAGRHAEAVPLLEQAVGQSVAMRLVGGHSFLVGCLGEGLLAAGRIGEAAEQGRRALGLAREHKERGYEAWALRLLAETARRAAEPDEGRAREHAGQALGLAEELGMRPLAAQCRLELGRIAAAAGNRTKAVEGLSAARDAFARLDMAAGRAQAQAELDALR